MSALGDVAVVALIGAVGLVGYEAFSVTKGFTQPLTNPTSSVDPSTGLPDTVSPATQAGQAAGAAAGQAATGVVSGAANSIWLGGNSICDFITFWRHAGAPNASVFGFNVPLSGGGNTTDWAAFSRWMQISNQFDPGPTPPGCW